VVGVKRSGWIANRMTKNCTIFLLFLISMLFGCSKNPNHQGTPAIIVEKTLEISTIKIGTITNTQSNVTKPIKQTQTPAPTQKRQITKIPDQLVTTENQIGNLPLFIKTKSEYPFFPFVDLPIPNGYLQEVDRSYPFGAMMSGETIAHEGVEFYNSEGTPVLAALGGKVIFSGNDSDMQWGRLKNFYGNLIILEHKDSRTNTIFFTLYAHLSEILVTKGDQVKNGQQIGKVGASGAALGSHLHFEIRLYEPNLENIVNPELFLRLIHEEESGMLAGKIVNADGEFVLNNPITIQAIKDGKIDSISNVRFISTYATNKPERLCCNENFVLSNIQVGDYRVTTYIDGVFYEKQIKIIPNSITYINFGF